MELGELTTAIRMLEEMVGADPKDPQALRALGHAYTALGDREKSPARWEKARSAYERLTDLKPDDPDAWYGLCCAASRLKDRPSALAAIEKVIEKVIALAPDEVGCDEDGYYALGYKAARIALLFEMDRWREAFAALGKR